MLGKGHIERVAEHVWEIPKTFRDDMRVPARLYADEDLLDAALADNSVVQLVNTATNQTTARKECAKWHKIRPESKLLASEPTRALKKKFAAGPMHSTNSVAGKKATTSMIGSTPKRSSRPSPSRPPPSVSARIYAQASA